jgi:hypothetical protein
MVGCCGGGSRLCAVPPGVILADALRSSEVMTDPDAAADRCEESLPRLREIPTACMPHITTWFTQSCPPAPCKLHSGGGWH